MPNAQVLSFILQILVMMPDSYPSKSVKHHLVSMGLQKNFATVDKKLTILSAADGRSSSANDPQREIGSLRISTQLRHSKSSTLVLKTSGPV